MSFLKTRLTAEPHYFGMATVGTIYPDRASTKGDLFALIQDFQQFQKAVPIKSDGNYYESIPRNRESNYWRDGVRAITSAIYKAILTDAGKAQAASAVLPIVQGPGPNDDFESDKEGSKTLRYVTTYERDPRYRRQALAIHGLRCKACGVDMGEKYGPYAEGLIHVHHVVPVSEYETAKKIDPATELVPVCPNCHAVIHRKKTSTLSVEDVCTLLDTSAKSRTA